MEGVFTAIERAAPPKRAIYSDFAATPATFRNRDRIIQRRAYGLRNEDYLRLRVLICTLPTL